MTAGAAVVKCIATMLDKGKRIAATLLEAAESDIGYAAGRFSVVGTDRRISLFEVAARAAELKKHGAIEENLDTKVTTETPLTFPEWRAHRRGRDRSRRPAQMDIVAYSAVDDCGNVLNGMIVEGQLHGALAQGLGQALMEEVFYDDERAIGDRLVPGLRHAARR